MLSLQFEDGSAVDISLDDDSPLKDFISKTLKHLQHVKLEFYDWDNPYWSQDPAKTLLQYAADLGIDIKTDRIIENQQLLNHLHEIYEKNYNGDPKWLKFHEQIHQCEQKSKSMFVLNIEWREKAGMLNSSISKSTIDEFGVTKVSAGDVCMSWSELGKIPYQYWMDDEPDNISRLCELAKPWTTLRPKFDFYTNDFDFLLKKMKYKESFNKWWKQFEEGWCSHWNLSSYDFEDQFKLIKVGTVNDLDFLNKKLNDFVNPVHLKITS